VAFDALDTDGDGALSQKECLKFHQSFRSAPSDIVNLLFATYDINYSGYIEYEEVTRMLEEAFGTTTHS